MIWNVTTQIRHANNEERKIVAFIKKFVNELTFRNSDIKVKKRFFDLFKKGVKDFLEQNKRGKFY